LELRKVNVEVAKNKLITPDKKKEESPTCDSSLKPRVQ
jgi:hypothetical protein